MRIRLVDVGARGGIDSRWKPFYHLLDVVAFEPDPKECAVLSSQRHPYSVRFLPEALGACDGQQATLFMCRGPGSSSVLRPNMKLCGLYPFGEAMEVVGEHPITLQRLDTVCRDFQPDVLKVDTQGTELSILQGAVRLLRSALAVELEVEFVQQYSGQPLFSDVDPFMRQQGFTLRALKRSYWRTKGHQLHPYGGQIVHGDALYLRLDRIDCDKGHVILSAYRQYDLLAHFGASHLIPKTSLPLRLASRLLSRHTNRGLRRFVDSLRPPSATDWHDPDFF
ncbi:MAG TPA: FkbM family methyltransferase [Verrucomicrobiae bacterium]|nr:FkbM family methyltransferase [Verrucomicrobiae bacterium]